MRLCALLLALAGAAGAAPPDARLLLTGRRPRIEKIDNGFTEAEAEPAGVLRAELLPTGELLLEPQGPGVARVFLFARRLVRVLEVAVDVPLPPPPAEAPPPGCVDSAQQAQVATAPCYAFWRARLLHLTAAEAPALSFDDQGLLAEVKAAQAALEAAGLHVKAALSPFGLRLVGAKDEGEKRRALRAVWPAILGALRLDE